VGSLVPDLLRQLCVETAASYLPMWVEWGVRDEGHLVHSLGCTFLTAVGRELEFASISEVPAPRGELPLLAHVDQDVRSDSVWFDRATRAPRLIAEFERYEGKDKDLGPKAQTLLLAQQRWGNPEAVLLMAYWTLGLVSLPDHESLRRVVRGGFEPLGIGRIPGSPRAEIVFMQFVLKAGADGLLRLSNIIRRGES
jgi:hypothetical protein